MTQKLLAKPTNSGLTASVQSPHAARAEGPDPTLVQRAQMSPSSLSTSDIMAIQRSAGNRAVLRLLGRQTSPPPVQRALKVGPAHDRYEEEADRVAGQVAQRSVAPPTPSVGAEGGILDHGAGQEIRQARSGGKPIADALRAPMENALGTDFGHARLHTGARADRLNAQMGARAFTVGSDIFMKRDEFNPTSRAGKHLLYHELTHVQQQTGGRNRSPAQGTVQRKLAIVRSPVWSRSAPGTLDTLDAKQKVKQVARGKKLTKYGKLQRVQLDNADDRHITDKDGNVAWYHLLNTDAFLPASKVLAGIKPSGSESVNPDLGGEDVESLVGSIGDVPGSIDNDLVEAQQWYFKKDEREGLTDAEDTESTKLNKAEAGMWLAGSALGTVSGIMGMASSLKTLRDDEAGTWDKVDAVFEYFASGMDTIGGLSGTMGSIAGMVNQGAEEGSKAAATSEAVSGWGFGYQAMFGTLSSGIKTVKSVADLVRMIYKEKSGKATFDRDEYLNTISDILTGALDTVRGVLVSIRQITQLVQGGIMDVFDKIIPGLDIAVAAVNIIFETYYLIESAVQHWWMKTRKKELVTKLQQEKGYEKDEIKQAQKYYAKGEAKKSNVGSRIAKNTKSIDKTDKKLGKTDDLKKGFDLVKKKVELRRENRGLDTKQQDTEQELQDYETQQHPTRSEVAEIDLTSELKAANRKRIVRQSIHIGSNLMKIAGSIVTLTAGPGAPAGIGLKAAAAGVDVSLPIFRSLKQWGRNKAAKHQAKGTNNKTSKFFTKIFNANKSTAAKLMNRKKQAVKTLLFVASLNQHIPIQKDPAKKKALAKDVRIAERYIRAAGCSPARLYRANGNAGEQIKILVEALSKRELG